MSFATPRSNLFAIMESLGFVAVKNAIDFENIGDTKLDKAFHVTQETVSSDAHDQQTVGVDNPQTLRFYNKGKKDTNVTMTKTLEELDTIMNRIMDIKNRTDGVRNILFDEFSAVEHSDDNNDIIRGELSITYKQTFCFQAP